MTPTPDPPPATPLTAEQIAAIRAHYNKMTSGLASWELYDIPALIASHAALRDRLARVEAAGLRVLTSWDREDEPDIVDAFEALRDILGTPTAPYDGAAWARDAAKGGD